MQSLTIHRILCVMLLFTILTACGGQTPLSTAALNSNEQSNEAPSLQAITAPVNPTNAEPTLTPILTLLQSSTPTPGGPTLTPTLDTRPLPDDWKKWSVVPGISARAVEIYRRGLANGNDPTHFSVVGDCQSIPGVFMGYYDTGEYSLNAPYLSLQKTIDHFRGSFLREGMAVRGGFTAASLLSPIQADPQYCKPGETPLTCEFRIHNPSILIISLETWADPKTIERYEDYLRQIIERSLEHGTLPLLGTKADVAEVGGGRHVINPILARLAYEYDLPLWNWWRAAQGLPNGGIDSTRDGFHLTEDGWKLKSFVALQALDAAYHAGQAGTDVISQPSATLTLAPSVTPAPAVLPQPAFCKDNPECILFGLMQSRDGNLQYGGVYWFDLTSQRLASISPDGFNLQAVSLDKQWLLVNQADRLMLAQRDGSQQVEISDQFFDLGKQDAYFLPGGERIAWIGGAGDETRIYLYDTRSAQSQPLTAPGMRPIELLPSSDTNGVYFQQGVCTAIGACQVESLWYAPQDGNVPRQVQGVIQPVFANSGGLFAFMDPQYNAVEDIAYNDKLVVEDVNVRLPSRRLYVFPASTGYQVRNRLVTYAISPDSSRVFALVDHRSAYFEKSQFLYPYVVTFDNGWLLSFERLTGEMPQGIWAVDNRWLLVGATDAVNSGGFRINFHLIDTQTNEQRSIDQSQDLLSQDYIYITNIYW